jgi:hypothetical protein
MTKIVSSTDLMGAMMGRTATATQTATQQMTASTSLLSERFSKLGAAGTGLLSRYGGFLTVLGPIGAALGTVGYVAHASVDSFTELATKVRDLSFLSGGTAEQVSVLVTGLDDLGVGSEAVQTALNKMSAEITSGGQSLARLGVSTRDSNGQLKSGLSLFYETVDALGSMKNEVERNSLARDIFGRGWMEMLPVIQRGSAAIKELGEENVRLGLKMDEAGIQKAREYKLALNELGDRWEATKISLAGSIIAPITFLLKWAGSSGSSTPQEVLDDMTLLSRSIEEWRKEAAVIEPIPGPVGGAWPATPSPKGTEELKRELDLRKQLNQLVAATEAARAAALPEGEAKIKAQLAAQIEVIKAKEEELNLELDIRKEMDKTPRGQAETATLRANVILASEAQIAQVQKDSANKAREERLRNDEFLTIRDMTENYRQSERQKNAQFAQVGAYDYEAIYAEGIKRSDEEITARRQKLHAEDLHHARVNLEFEEWALKDALEQGTISYQTYYLEIEKLRQKNSENNEQALLGEYYATDDFFKKVHLGLQVSFTDWQRWDDKLLDLCKGFARTANQFLDDLFFKVLTGNLKSFADFWKSLWNSLARSLSQTMAQMVLSSIFGSPTGGGASGLLAGLFGGAGGNLISGFNAAAGTTPLSADTAYLRAYVQAINAGKSTPEAETAGLSAYKSVASTGVSAAGGGIGTSLATYGGAALNTTALSFMISGAEKGGTTTGAVSGAGYGLVNWGPYGAILGALIGGGAFGGSSEYRNPLGIPDIKVGKSDREAWDQIEQRMNPATTQGKANVEAYLNARTAGADVYSAMDIARAGEATVRDDNFRRSAELFEEFVVSYWQSSGGRQHGGPVWPGQKYTVEETWPEVVRFHERGEVIPLPRAAAMGLGKGVTIKNNISIGPVTIATEVDLDKLSERIGFEAERGVSRALARA